MRNLATFARKHWLTGIFVLLIAVTWAVVIMASGTPPLAGFLMILQGTFSDKIALFSTLNIMVPLMLLAIAVAVPGWTGTWNIGGEGQFMLGAMVAAWVGAVLPLNQGLLCVAVALVLSAAAGLVWASWAGALKTRFNINEIVTTLMANYVATLFVSWLVNYPLKAAGSAWAQTAVIRDPFKIPPIVKGTQFSITFFVALAVVVFFQYFRRRFKKGYEFTITGSNERFARIGGVSVGGVRLLSMLMGGAAAGLAGGLVVLGNAYRMKEGISPGFGFTGLLVCLLAANDPVAIIVISFLFAVIQMGSLNLQLLTDIPVEIGGVLQVVLILYVAAFRMLTGRKGRA